MEHDLIRRIDQHFMKLATIGIQPDGSISRLAFSDEESAAMAYIRAEGEMFGLAGSYDGIGNLVLSLPQAHKRRMLVGSHIDSVPRGGNYDGAAGIIAGLEAIRSLVDDGVAFERGVDLVIWRGEEYTSNAVYKGSAAAFGVAEPHILHNVYGDVSLRDAIRRQGFDPSHIDEGRATFDPSYAAGIDGYIEAHIEQGAVLQQETKELGIVTSVAGDRRFLVVLEGRFDHSGATPMGRRYRGDVNLAMAHTQVQLDELAKRMREANHVFTQTVGIVNADPEIDRRYPSVHGNSVTKVSGMGYFTLDIMGAEDAFLDDYAAEVLRVIWRVAREYNVKAFIEQTNATGGVQALDPALQAELRRSCDELDITHMDIPSGAGHDAVVVSHARRPDGTSIPAAMLFIPCRNGISHSKEEFAEPAHVALAARVLARTLQRLLTAPTA